MTNIVMERDKLTKEIVYKENNWSEKERAFFNQIKFLEETPESIHKSTAYYLQKFYLYEQGKKYLGWHWSAFLWSFYWGNYRKLYCLFFIEIFVGILSTLMLIYHQKIFEEALTNNSFLVLTTIIFIGYRIVLGCYANLFYVRKIVKKIKKGSRSYKPNTWLILITILASSLIEVVSRYF